MTSGKSYYEIQSQVALPFLPTSLEIIEDVFKILKNNFGLKNASGQMLIDLGSGDGRVVIYAAKTYNVRAVGVEINSNLNKEAVKKIHEEKVNDAAIIKGDLFSQDLNKFDFIFIFALPDNYKFLQHVFKTIKRGAIIIIHKYPIKGNEFNFKLEYVVKHENKDNVNETYIYKKI
ncbi:MAG: SAM-dependent methyltransferase [Promethearchaeota archaeon]